MNPWIAQLTTIAGGRLLAQLEGPEGTFGASATELLLASSDGVRRIRLTAITRIARSGGAVIISGPEGELLRVTLNVPNDALLGFFQAVKTIANQARLLERDRLAVQAVASSEASPEIGPPASSLPPAAVLPPAPIARSLAEPKPGPSDKSVSRPAAPMDTAASSIFWPVPNIGDDAVNNSLDHLRVAEDGSPQEPAPFRTRLLAGLLDAGLFLSFQFLISRLLGLYPATPFDLIGISADRVFNPSDYWWVITDVGAVIGFTVVLSWPYFALFEASGLQGTPGKLALRLNVSDLAGRRADFGRTTWRHLARLVPALCGFALWFGGTAFAFALDEEFGRKLGLGVLVAFTVLGLAFPVIAYLRARTDAFGQTLHDQIAGCMVQTLEPAPRRARRSGASASAQRND